MKIVINKCYGGFGLSPKAQQMYANRKGKHLTFYRQTKYKYCDRKDEYQRVDSPKKSLFLNASTKDLGAVISDIPDKVYWYPSIERDDPDLLAVLEELGSEEASGDCAKLSVVKIPDGTDYTIEEYDGREWIAERHNTWS